MSNYKETQITATKYQRAKMALLINEKDSNPTIAFTEEQIVVLQDGTSISKECDRILETLTTDNKLETFDIIDGDNIVGQATYQDVYNMLSSLYLHVANKRDANNIVQPIVEA